jgi:hypothetical protein
MNRALGSWAYDGIALKLGGTGFGGDVGRILGVGRGLGDGIGLGVSVAVAVGVGVGDGVGLALGLGVGVGVGWPPVKRRIMVPIPPTAVPFSRSVKCTDMN